MSYLRCPPPLRFTLRSRFAFMGDQPSGREPPAALGFGHPFGIPMAIQEHRRSRRIAPPRALRARFLVQGQQVDAEVVSLGPGGFGAWTEDRFAFLFDPGTGLRDITFDDPTLPAPPAEASIAFSTLKGQSARDGFIMFGAEYQASDPAFLQAMAELMEKLGLR